eukprot:EG_transcript_3651
MHAVRNVRALKSQSAPPRLPGPFGAPALEQPRPPASAEDRRAAGPEWRREREQLVDALNALQRNFEGLSAILARERGEREALQQRCQSLLTQLDDARGQLKLNNIVRVELGRIQAEFASYREAMEQQGAFQVERFQEAVQELTQAKADLLVEEAQAILAAAEAEKALLEERTARQAAEARRHSGAAAVVAELERAVQRQEAEGQSLAAELAAARQALQEHSEAAGRAEAAQRAAEEQQRRLALEVQHLTAQGAEMAEGAARLRREMTAGERRSAARLGDLEEAAHCHRELLATSEAEARTALLALERSAVALKGERAAWQAADGQRRTEEAAELERQRQAWVAERAAAARRLEDALQALQEERSRRNQLEGQLEALRQQQSAAQVDTAARDTAWVDLQRRLATADNDVQRLQGEARLAALAAATADVLHAEAMARSALSLAEIVAWGEVRVAGAADRQCTAAERMQRVGAERDAALERCAVLAVQLEAAAAAAQSAEAANVLHTRAALDALEQAERAAVQQRALAGSLELGQGLWAGVTAATQRRTQQLQERCAALQVQQRADAATTAQLKAALDAAQILAEERREELEALQGGMEELRQEKALQSEAEERKLLDLRTRAAACLHKLIATEEASESAYTCLACLQVYHEPTVCVPCGHTFCNRCIDPQRDDAHDMMFCRECGSHTVAEVCPARGLDLLCGKALYRRQALAGLLAEFQ